MRTADTYLVVDLEATCDDRGAIPHGANETIEIGAVLVDGRTLETIGELDLFVRPIVHPILTPFCIELTSITQAMVDNAPTFPAAAARLAEFGRGALFCSWGNYDRNQLARDARLHGIDHPLPGDHWNLKEGRGGMAKALEREGIALEGRHHRGIDDARNIVKLLRSALARTSPEPARRRRSASWSRPYASRSRTD